MADLSCQSVPDFLNLPEKALLMVDLPYSHANDSAPCLPFPCDDGGDIGGALYLGFGITGPGVGTGVASCCLRTAAIWANA
jgi:hypothetical protein